MKRDKKPRVLFVCPLPPPVHGSSMVSKSIIDSELVNEEFDVDYVNLSTSRSMAEIGKFSIAKVWRYFGGIGKMLWKLLIHRYDLVYLAITVNGVGFLKDFPYAAMARMFCKHRVIHQHNKGMSSYVHKFPYGRMLKFVYDGTKVILLSERLYEDISEIVSGDNVMVCPNGLHVVTNHVDGGAVDAACGTRLLYLSNLIESKGVYALLDACKILMDRGMTFHCDFVGGESKQITRALFDEAVKMRGLEDVVTYHGPKYGADKEVFWNAADVFVFPTFYYNECFPLVVLEAMQHGVPVVSSNEGGISDIVVDGVTGYCVDAQVLRVESVNEMLGASVTEEERLWSRRFNAHRGLEIADRLEQLLVDPGLRMRMGEAGRERFEREFTQDVFEKRIVECLIESMRN